MSESRSAQTLDVAARISEVLRREKVDHALIGSVALAVHGFVRATRDLDFAVLVSPSPRLASLADALRREGYTVELSAPAPDDELGGVLTVVGDAFDPVQIVNFYNPPRAPPSLVKEAIQSAVHQAGLPFPVAGLAPLVALKLSTGAFRDEVDVGDLLEARPDAPLDVVRDVCARHGVADALARVLARLGRTSAE
jgi:hypothetical protein